ncbi:MAG: presqualene diphosphate synthase HpnD [Candidatus Dormibacteraeota bacterium]|nr:presqualene diphosphate synthase HpnD [Candidatus Dormibacteraeota bacterium]
MAETAALGSRNGSVALAGTPVGLRASEKYCEAMARREAANFYWGFLALPRPQRTAIYALYDFARQVDDEADSDATPAAGRLAGLDRHRQRLSNARSDDSTDPVMSVLAHAMARYSIPASELEMLIDGVGMDLAITRYGTFAELREYCQLVASIVGRMCVRIFGFRDPRALELADELGVALQLINILRDVREDASRGRIYLPLDELRAFGIAEQDVLRGWPAPRWNEFIAFQAARARRHHAAGIRVTEHIPRTAAVCVRTMAGIYTGILDRIEHDPMLPLRRRASLSPVDKLGVMARSWIAAL